MVFATGQQMDCPKEYVTESRKVAKLLGEKN